MKGKTATMVVLGVLSSLTFGKGVSDYVESPSFEFDITGSIRSNNGSAVAGVLIWIDLTTVDTSYVERYYNFVRSDDSGSFQAIVYQQYLNYRQVRITAINGKDTSRSQWMFANDDLREEKTRTIMTHDCNSHTKEIPVSEIYTFPKQSIIIN